MTLTDNTGASIHLIVKFGYGRFPTHPKSKGDAEHAKRNKDKCVQEPRPKGFVGQKKQKKTTTTTTTTSDISSRALIKPIVCVFTK